VTWTAVRWSDLNRRGWKRGHWLAETLQQGDTTWFARRSRVFDPQRRPVVMVHGLVVSGAYFGPLIEHAPEIEPISIPDTPGFGLSSGDPPQTTVAGMSYALARWLDAHGLSRAVFVGNSVGCQIATHLAVDRPDLVSRLVLIGPTFDPRAKSVVRLILRGMIDIPRERQTLWTIWVPDFLRAGPLRALRTLVNALRDPQLERLGKVGQPTLIIGGEDDPIAPPEWVEEMAECMPRARAIIVPAAPHALHYSAAPDVTRIIRAAISMDEEAGSTTRLADREPGTR
jgi:2-hydroxy-6-oxonona-2,4-dienedioate hydrolase